MQPDLLTLIFKLLPAVLALMIPIAAIVGGVIIKLRRMQTNRLLKNQCLDSRTSPGCRDWSIHTVPRKPSR